MELVNVSRPLSSLRKVLDKKPCLFPEPVWKAWNTEATEWEASGTGYKGPLARFPLGAVSKTFGGFRQRSQIPTENVLVNRTASGHFLPVTESGHCLSSVSPSGNTLPPCPEQAKPPLCGCGFGVAQRHPTPWPSCFSDKAPLGRLSGTYPTFPTFPSTILFRSPSPVS